MRLNLKHNELNIIKNISVEMKSLVHVAKILEQNRAKTKQLNSKVWENVNSLKFD